MKANIADRIIHGLPGPVMGIIEAAGLAASRSRQRLYLVGGIVRDLLLGRESNDIDIMAEKDAIALANSLSLAFRTKPVIHTSFGTATFHIAHFRLDLATCRSETYDHPGALPRVERGSIEQDLLRRDFTINAMAACINPESFGEVIDPYGGRSDLTRGLIRVLHDNSFIDDATRIMRAVRYEQRLDFKLELKTSMLLHRDIDILDTISGDRLRHEIMLWFSELHPQNVLKRAFSLGILGKLHPSLTWDAKLSRAFRSINTSTGNSLDINLYLALLFYNLNTVQAAELMSRLNIAGGDAKKVIIHTVSLKRKQPLFEDTALKPSDIYVKLHDFHPLAVTANAYMAASPAVRSNLRLYVNKLRLIKPVLNGQDLASLGVPAGRKMGTVLNQLLKARLDREVKTRGDEEKLVKQWLLSL